jgi:hypothetical protein
MADSSGESKEEDGHVEFIQRGRQMNDEEYNRLLKPSLNMIIATMFLSCDPLHPLYKFFSAHPSFSPLDTLRSPDTPLSCCPCHGPFPAWITAMLTSCGTISPQIRGVHNHYPVAVALFQPL